jgi:hypothetical protein
MKSVSAEAWLTAGSSTRSPAACAIEYFSRSKPNGRPFRSILNRRIVTPHPFFEAAIRRGSFSWALSDGSGRVAGLFAEGAEVRSQQLLCEIEFQLIDITPTPVFSRLDGLHDRVLGSVEMFRGMLVLWGIAATDIPARHALPQMNPSVPHFDTLFANTIVWWLHIFDLIQVRALFHVHAS